MKRVWTLLLVLLLLTGCAARREEQALQSALDNIQPALVQMDRRYALYGGALTAVRAYVENPTEPALTQAKKACMDAIAEMALLPEAENKLTAEEEQTLTQMGLNLADYRVPFEQEAQYRAQSVREISFLLYQMEHLPEQAEGLKQFAALADQVNEVYRQVDCLCINEVFCAFDAEAIENFKKTVLPGLPALFDQEYLWETDSDVLMARADKYMTDAEDEVDVYAAFIGSQYTQMLAAEDEVKDKMAQAGYSGEQIDAVERLQAQE